MATSPLPSVLVALGAKVPSTEPDGDLLSRYVSNQDDAAFALLVRRYCRLVWRVARTRCRTESTAEDVFQATFVVLARKAGSIRTGGALPGWLHRTAYRLAVKAARAERPQTPLVADTPVSADPLDALTARELLVAVDDELARMSDTERSVLVLCGVENEAVEDAAVRLGCSTGAVKGRLERARAKLRNRLQARGLIVPAILFTLFASPTTASVQAATTTALGGTVSPKIETLLAEGSRMTRRIITAGLAAILVASGFGTGVGLFPRPVTSTAFAAPVPKQKGSAVLWSDSITLKETDTLRSTGGVWLPDGSAVLVPAPTKTGDGKRAAGGVEVRDAKTGEGVSRYTAEVPEDGTFQAVAVAVSADGSRVFAGGTMFDKDGKKKDAMFTWKVGRDSPEVNWEFKSPISAVSVTPDGKMVAVVEAANSVVQLQLPQVVNLSSWKLNKKTYQTGVYHSSSKYFVVATDSGSVSASEAATGKMIGLMNYDATFHAIAVSPEGDRIAVGGAPGKAKQSLAVIDEASGTSIGNKFRTFTDAVPEKEAINGLAFSPDGKHLAAACSDGLVRVFDVETGKLITTSAKEHSETAYSVAYSPDGKKLLTVGKDAVKVWDVTALVKGK